MGSDAHVITVGGSGELAGRAVRRIDELERRWSRFLADSEVSRLNDHAGEYVNVSGDTVTLIERATDAWRLSGGAFDPTVLGAVVRAGYDRSFELLGAGAGAGAGRAAGRSMLGLGAGEIAVEGTRVRLAPGTGFDPGGIGKGLAADMVCAELMAAGAEGACVNLGGDVRVAGCGPEGAGWTVAIEHPSCDVPVAVVGVADGAVATSTTLRRRWESAGQVRHHLIDPRTGLPSDSDVVLAAVVGAQAWVAEVLAKAVLLAGSRHPFDIVGGTGAEALIVDVDGGIRATAGLRLFLGAMALQRAMRPA